MCCMPCSRKMLLLLSVCMCSASWAQPPRPRFPGPGRPPTGRQGRPDGGDRLPAGVQAQRDLTYAQASGKPLKLDLYLPEKASGALPVLVWVHGGGWQSGSKEQCLPLRSGFVERGYALVSIDYRLSGEATFPAQIEDCKAAIRWLRANADKYHLDADHIGVWGSSAGGHLVALLGTSGDVKPFDRGEHPDLSSRVQAVCDFYGPTDLVQMVTTPRYERHATADSPESKLIGGAVLEHKDWAAKANPITYITKDDPPFLIIHGDSDPVVPPGQSQLLHDALTKAGVESKLRFLKGAKHGGPEFGQADVTAEVEAFFARHLKPSSGRKPATAAGSAPAASGAPTPEPSAASAASSAATATAPPITSSLQPIGLFVCRGPGPTSEREVNFPFITGWLVRPGWDRVEPREGQFDWSYIDNEIAFAKRLSKKITLSVLGGPQAPEWVYQAGAKKMTYNFRGTRQSTIPVLWDEVYLKKWGTLVQALGKRYSKESTVILVHITGATGNGLEMQLPFLPDDLQQWQRLGYSAEKAIAAWSRITDQYATAFPQQPLDIDIHPVLGSDRVAEEVAAYGSKKLGKRFGIFGGWISGKSTAQDRHHAGLHAIAAKYGPAGFAAFQMIASYSRTPDRLADGGLAAAMSQGLAWNARYYEIWESDAMNTSLHAMLSQWAARLRQRGPGS